VITVDEEMGGGGGGDVGREGVVTEEYLLNTGQFVRTLKQKKK